MSGQLQTQPAFSPGEQLPVPTEYEAGWAPEAVWAVWRRDKSVAPPKIEHWIIQQRFNDRFHLEDTVGGYC